MQCIGINLTMEVKSYTLNTIRLWWKKVFVTEDTNKWKDTQCSWIPIINIVKTATLPIVFYGISAIPAKIQMEFFTEIENIILKFVWNPERPQMTKAIWERRTKLVDSHLLISIYIVSCSNETVWYWHKIWTQRPLEQNQGPRIKCAQRWSTNIWQGSKNTIWRKDSLLNKQC